MITKYFFNAFYKPVKTFSLLLEDARYFRLSFIFILIPIICYTLMYIFLTIGDGAPSVFTPWLNISKEDYYYYNRFLLFPGMIMAWLLSASVMHIAGRLSGGNGSFEQSVSVAALSIAVAMTPALLHDLPMSFCSALRIINAREHEIAMNAPTVWRTLLWIFYSLYFFAFLILFPLCVRTVHKLSKPLSALIGVSGFILFQTVFLIFNR